MVFNAKGGVGKTAVSLNIALTHGYAVVTNDPLSIIDSVLEKNRHAILDDGEPLPEIDADIPVLYDFGGFPDQRAIPALKEAQALIVPTLSHSETLQTTLNFLEEIRKYKRAGILVVVNQAGEKEYQAVKSVLSEFYPDLPVLPLKKSKVIGRMIRNAKSIAEIVQENGLNAYHFGAIQKQFNRIFEHLSHI